MNPEEKEIFRYNKKKKKSYNQMNLDKQTQEKIQHLQILEQTLQNLLIQKQAFQFELSETTSALEEIKNTKDEVYKLIGQVMIKSSKKEIEKNLEHKKELLNLRINSIDKQEEKLKKDTESIRSEVLKHLK